MNNYNKPSAAKTVENIRMLIAKLCSNLMDLYRLLFLFTEETQII